MLGAETERWEVSRQRASLKMFCPATDHTAQSVQSSSSRQGIITGGSEVSHRPSSNRRRYKVEVKDTTVGWPQLVSVCLQQYTHTHRCTSTEMKLLPSIFYLIKSEFVFYFSDMKWFGVWTGPSIDACRGFSVCVFFFPVTEQLNKQNSATSHMEIDQRSARLLGYLHPPSMSTHQY